MINSDKLSLFRDQNNSGSIGLVDISITNEQEAVVASLPIKLRLNKETVSNLISPIPEEAGNGLSVFKWVDCGKGIHWWNTKCAGGQGRGSKNVTDRDTDECAPGV